MSGEANNELLQWAIEGDRDAITELLLQETDDLSRFISHQLGSSPPAGITAEDLLQDTLYEAIWDIRRFQPQDGPSFRSWLRAIVQHRPA